MLNRACPAMRCIAESIMVDTTSIAQHSPICTPMVESTTQGDSQLVVGSQGEVSRSGTPRHSARRSRGIELATFGLPVNTALPPEPHAAPQLCERQRGKNLFYGLLILYFK